MSSEQQDDQRTERGLNDVEATDREYVFGTWAYQSDPNAAKEIQETLRNNDIVVGVGGFHTNVVKIQPPLTISRNQLERGVDELKDALERRY
jgi:4-aminobutyrate aminotransferase-like enzyme